MGTATRLLTQRVAFSAPTGTRTNRGDPTFGPVQTIPCRHETRTERVQTAAGVTLQESTVIVSETEIPQGSLVWLDGTGAGDRTKARQPQQRGGASKPDLTYGLFETRL